jgi:Domain of unknown function (DUF4399)
MLTRVVLKRLLVALLFCLTVFWVYAVAQVVRQPSVEGAQAFIMGLEDGQIVEQCDVPIKFGLEGMGIAPAGVNFENTGHFHVLIDTDETQLDMNAALPYTDKILHYGKGETGTCLQLAPGDHTLQLMLGDYMHVPHDPAVVSKKITITVK